MRETKVMVWRISADPGWIPPAPGDWRVWNLNLYADELIREIGEDWTPVSHHIVDRGEAGVVLTMLIEREVQIPDSLDDAQVRKPPSA